MIAQWAPVGGDKKFAGLQAGPVTHLTPNLLNVAEQLQCMIHHPSCSPGLTEACGLRFELLTAAVVSDTYIKIRLFYLYARVRWMGLQGCEVSPQELLRV